MGASVLVSAAYPHRIVDHSASFSDLFEFKRDELNGSSLRLIFGPESDTKRLQMIIMNSVHNVGEGGSLVFYKKNGDQVICKIRAYATTIDGCDVSGLVFDVQDWMLRNDIPSSLPSKPESQKKSMDHTSIEKLEIIAQDRSWSSPDMSTTSIDPAVFLHMKAVQEAASAAHKRI